MNRLKDPDLRTPDFSSSFPLLSVAGTIAFPGLVVAVPLSRTEDMAVVRGLESGDVVIQVIGEEADNRDFEPDSRPDGHGGRGRIGVAAWVLTGITSGDTVQVVLEGIERVRILSAEGSGHECRAFVEPFLCSSEPLTDVNAAADTVVRNFRKLVRMDLQLSPELGRLAQRKRGNPAELADFIAQSLSLQAVDRQSVVEAPCVSERLRIVGDILEKKFDTLRLELKIQDRARARVEAEQKQKFLREQLKEIRAALGEATDTDLITTFRNRLQASHVPPDVLALIETELHRLDSLPPASVEYDVTRHHIEALLSLPWTSRSTLEIDLGGFERRLEEDLIGLARTKREIMEFVSVMKLNESAAGPALAIVGPSGVGRGAIASSIARGLGRPLVRIDLESIESAEELTGIRHTAIGGEPGLVVKAVIESGVMNPVLLLEGLDSLREDASPRLVRAILSILDPARRPRFLDDFLRVPVDLGEVLVIATAMTPFGIPEPFLDALAIVTVSSYIDSEKVAIARRHLIPKQLESHGLTGRGVEWTDEAILHIIRRYTREPGVWQLNRMLATMCRKLAHEAALGNALPGAMGEAEVVRFLGRPRVPMPGTGRADEVGVALGLAWTADGGDILQIEAIRLPGNGEVQLTGQLGEVMRESAAAALSFVRSRFVDLNIPPAAFHEATLHINLPEGAIPKDGPSAGITLAVVIASLMTNRPVRHDVAMTGEITLRGRILPVGGVREKILGAHRAGIRTVILPLENAPELEDVPEPIVKEMRFVPVETADQAIEEALVKVALPSHLEVVIPGAEPTVITTSPGNGSRSRRPVTRVGTTKPARRTPAAPGRTRRPSTTTRPAPKRK